MSHKTEYRTFSNTDLNVLETQVNDFIKGLHKNEHHEEAKIQNITTLTMNETYVVAITYANIKKKKTETDVAKNEITSEGQRI